MKISSTRLSSIILLLVLLGLMVVALNSTVSLSSNYGAKSGGGYDPWADVNDDGVIDISDGAQIGLRWFTSGTPLAKAYLAYDSGWVDIHDMAGQYTTITHNLGSMDGIADITGKTTLDGGVHQRYLGGTDFVAGWNKTYGGTSDDVVYSVVQTSDGGYACSGITKSFGAGDWDFWLVKTDAAGNMKWNKAYGGPDVDYCTWVIQTSDGGYALAGNTYSFGASDGDAWFVKTDVYGNMQWSKTYGGAYFDGANSIIQTGDAGYVLGGCTYSYVAGSSYAWLIKTDANGNMLWNNAYGGGDVATCVIQTDGGYLFTGNTRRYGAGGADVCLVKADLAGNLLWDKTYGGIGDDYGSSVVQTYDGGYAVYGSTQTLAGGDDFWLIKTDASGNMLWDKTYGGPSQEGGGGGTSLVQTDDGGYAMTGFTWSFGAGGMDAWLVRTDSIGNMLWNKAYGGANDDYTDNLIQTSDGGFALVGWTHSYGAGGVDGWLVKTDAMGNALDGFKYGLAWTESTTNTVTLYRGTDDTYWNYVRVRIWAIKNP